MQRPASPAVATCVRALLVAGVLAAWGGAPAAAGAPAAGDVFGPPFAARPLDTLRVTGGYAEVRSGHFHGGLDFSTSGHVGRPVHAPAPGTVERVRASGTGYGRSVYLRADDGRLLVFGHLDAFAPALAAWVDSAQRASGTYERDLWPAPGRFRFRAGESLAWTGESGAGPPHLHFEVRHGDFAVHPLRGGLVPGAVGEPRLLSLVLEPLDAGSRVAGGLGPHTLLLRAQPETLEVEGRLRAVVRSRSGLPGAEDAPAWSTRLEWNGESVEARLDSISWAGEMSQLELLVDRAGGSGLRGWRLWAPAGFRPRFLRTSAPDSEAAGVLRVARGDAPRVLRLVAGEPGGREVERRVVLVPPAGAGPPPVRGGPAAGARRAATPREPGWRFAVLPDQQLRARVTGVPAGAADVRLTLDQGVTSSPASWDGAAWVAIADARRAPSASEPRLLARRPDGSAWSSASGGALWRVPGGGALAPVPGARLGFDRETLFQEELVLVRPRARTDGRAQGLLAAGQRLELAPADLALRRPLLVTLAVDGAAPMRGVGLYRRGEREWEYVGATLDEASRTVTAPSADVGDFAVMRDTLAPVVEVRAPLAAAARPYSRWQLVARVSERGSGVDAARSAFVVDGTAAPTEWDPEQRQLRWRPLAPPPPGTHRYELRVVDRAGNATMRRGSFVLDSGRR